MHLTNVHIHLFPLHFLLPKHNSFHFINSNQTLMATFSIFHLAVFLAVFSSLAQSHTTRKLDETTSPADSGNKCGGCPCDNPCNPPPSPPPPSPKKPPPSNYCPPPPSGVGSGSQFPPSPPYIYIKGPPQDLYPIGTNISGSNRRYFSIGPGPLLISWAVGLIIACMG